MRRLVLVAAVALLTASCLKGWDVGGPWACRADGGCPGSATCDDGVCCVPGGEPACPTLPVADRCPTGEPVTLYPDRDGDGFGAATGGRAFCSRPQREAWVASHDDCDDTTPARHPRAPEACNGLDDDCDGQVDNAPELVARRTRWFLDEDRDGFGVSRGGDLDVLACRAPPGFADRAGDCAPQDPAIHPGRLESCGMQDAPDVDDNCNGVTTDGPYDNTESPGLDGGARFTCNVPGAMGRCLEGALVCAWDERSASTVARCVPRQAPSTDVCANGVDEDCDGQPDNAPGCGGPASLLSLPGATVTARAVDVDGGSPALPPGCLGDTPGAAAMAWLNPSWVGTGPRRHVWTVQAPAGQFWDLSKSGTTLNLALESTTVGGPTDGGSAWGTEGWFPNPVVTLCDGSGRRYRRFIPSGPALLKGTWSAALSVDGANPDWTREGDGSGFDVRQVRRVEVVVSPTAFSPNPVTFRVTFGAATGFSTAP